MFKTISENSNVIKRLVAGQLSISVFSFVILAATSMNKPLTLAASIFCVCFYMYIVYTFMWEAGAKISTRPDKPDSKTITKTSLIILLTSNIFNVLCAIVYTICKIAFTVSGNEKSVLTTIGTLTWTVVKFVQGMYMGIDAFIFYSETPTILLANPIYFFLIIVPTFIFGILAYKLGTSDFSILRKMGFKTKHQSRADRNYKSTWR